MSVGTGDFEAEAELSSVGEKDFELSAVREPEVDSSAVADTVTDFVKDKESSGV